MSVWSRADLRQTEVHHPWLHMILSHLFEITLVDNLRRVKMLATLGRWCLPWLTVRVRDQHSNQSREKVKRFVFLFLFLL